MNKTLNDSTGASFVAFWDYVVEKGLMNENTARSLGAAARAILSVEPNWEAMDIRSLDENELATRFKNLRARDYTPRSLNTYERRFKIALEYYVKYLADPVTWKGRSSKRSPGMSGSKEKAAGTAEVVSAVNGSGGYEGGSRLVTYPFPLRDECIVQLRLPMDLTTEDVERITTFLRSLVLESK